MSFASPSLPFIPRGIPLYLTLPAWQSLSCVALSRAPSSLALDLNLPLLFSSLTLPYSLSPLTPPRSARKCFSIRCRIAILIHMFSLVEVSFASLVSPLPATLHSTATPCATLLKLVRGCSWSTQSQWRSSIHCNCYSGRASTAPLPQVANFCATRHWFPRLGWLPAMHQGLCPRRIPGQKQPQLSPRKSVSPENASTFKKSLKFRCK